MAGSLSWSPWLPLDRDSIKHSVPRTSGVYQVRPIGAISVAYIGSATGQGGLKQRVGQRVSNPLRYLSVFEKQLIQIGFRLEFCYATTDTAELTKDCESQLLSDYKLKHNGKLPPGE
jgi:hypothetical protein